MRLGLIALATFLSLQLGCDTPAPTEADAPEARAAKRGKKGGRAKKKPGLNDQVKTDKPEIEGPNVLVVVWDTVRADHLSAYGYERETTPRLDAFAKEGLLFERAVSPGMWTLPSHASMFTGKPVTEHGAYPGHKILDLKFTTFAEHFRDHGYDTYLFSANPYLGDHTQLGQGFETREFPWDKAWKAKTTAATTGKLIASDASNALGPAFEPGVYSGGRSSDTTKDAGPVTAEALARWVKGRKDRDRPWLALLNYMEAHVPRVPSMEARKALFGDDDIERQLRTNQSFGYLLAHTMKLYEVPPEDVDTIRDTYDASLRDLDAAFGALVDTLSGEGWLDNTIVIITADHGEHLGEHHRIGHKFSVYQPLIRVPLVIRYPAKVEPGRVKEVVSNLGLFATLTELTQVPEVDGLLHGSVLQEQKRTGYAFSELAAATPMAFTRMRKVHPDFVGDKVAPFEHTYASVEGPDGKCIQRGDGERELYDMPADALETADLAPAQGERAEQLCTMIDAYRRSFEAYGSDGKKTKASDAGLSPEMKQKLIELGYAVEGEE